MAESCLEVSEMAETVDDAVQTIILDPISSKIDDIRHISQAIKSLRWKPQSQTTDSSSAENSTSQLSSTCSCGDAECIEVCDIREWLPTTKMDDELWGLVLLLGETYTVLGQCYVENDQFHRALQIAELGSTLVYGISMSQDTEPGDAIKAGSSPSLTSTYIFWARTWNLVGETYYQFHMVKGEEKEFPIIKLKMPSLVLKGERQRQSWHEGSFCYLMNCSCEDERTNSGTYASTSSSTAGKSINKKGHDHDTTSTTFLEENAKTRPRRKMGDIFKFLSGLPSKRNGGDFEYNLSAALLCFEEAKNALGECPCRDGSLISEMESNLMKKIGWAFKELGKNWHLNQELEKAETAYQNAITSFRQTSDHYNITIVYSNLGLINQLLAEMTVPIKPDLISSDKMSNTRFHQAYIQALGTAKHQYLKSLKYYAAAKMELTSIAEESVKNNLRSEVYTDLALAFLKLGMLLAREDKKAEIDDNCFVINKRLGKKELADGKHQVSAKDAISEAISIYESMGEVRRKETSYGYKELAMYHMNCCQNFLGSLTKETVSKSKNSIVQKLRQYVSLAEENWKKCIELYRADSHHIFQLIAIEERAAFLSNLSDELRSHELQSEAFLMLLKAVDILLEARHISVGELTDLKDMKKENAFVCDQYWSLLQLVSKNIIKSSSSSSSSSQQSSSHHPPTTDDITMFKDFYRKILRSSGFADLPDIYNSWNP